MVMKPKKLAYEAPIAYNYIYLYYHVISTAGTALPRWPHDGAGFFKIHGKSAVLIFSMAQNYLSQMLDAYQFYQEHDHFFVFFLFPHV